MAAKNIIQLVNRALELRVGLLGNTHARCEDAEIVWSCNVSGEGVKAWADGRAPAPKQGLLETFAKYEERLRSQADALLVEAVAICTKRVEAALAVV